MSFNGVDLSQWQGDIPDNPLGEFGLAELRFAYVQISQGTRELNPYAPQQVAALRKAGVAVGFYHFLTMDPLIDQTQCCFEMARALGGSKLPIAIDAETADPSGWPALATMMMDFASAVESWPQSVVIPHTKACFYVNGNFWHNLAPLGFPWGRFVWYANPNAPDLGNLAATILQSAPRAVAPFSGQIDPDVFQGDQAAWDRFAGVSDPWGAPPAPVAVAPSPWGGNTTGKSPLEILADAVAAQEGKGSAT